jgi:hypothetical protein
LKTRNSLQRLAGVAEHVLVGGARSMAVEERVAGGEQNATSAG